MSRLTDQELLGQSDRPLPRPGEHTAYDLVLVDRDGTLNVRRPGGYIERPERLVLLPGAAQLVRQFNEAGIPVVVVTNQQGIGKGVLGESDLVAVHRRLIELLGADGARLDGFQVCPHLAGSCGCRKPLPGLLVQALSRAPWARPERTLMIGDAASDAEAARAAGVRFQWVKEPAGQRAEDGSAGSSDCVT